MLVLNPRHISKNEKEKLLKLFDTLSKERFPCFKRSIHL